MGIKRIRGAAYGFVFLVASSYGLAADNIRNASEAATCVAEILRQAGAQNVKNGNSAENHPYIAYDFIDSASNRRAVQFELYTMDAMFFYYSLAKAGVVSEGSPVTLALAYQWETRCRARGLVVTR